MMKASSLNRHEIIVREEISIFGLYNWVGPVNEAFFESVPAFYVVLYIIMGSP